VPTISKLDSLLTTGTLASRLGLESITISTPDGAITVTLNASVEGPLSTFDDLQETAETEFRINFAASHAVDGPSSGVSGLGRRARKGDTITSSAWSGSLTIQNVADDQHQQEVTVRTITRETHFGPEGGRRNV